MDYVEKEYAVYTAKPAWHKKGKVLELSEARKMRPSEYVAKTHGYEILPVSTEMTLPGGSRIIVPNQYNLVRSTDLALLNRQSVTEEFHPLKPTRIAEVALDPYYDAGHGYMDACFSMYPGKLVGEVKYFGGRSVYMSMRLAGLDVIAPGDTEPTEIYFGLQDYTGGGKIRGKVTGTRGVCHNTVTALFAGGFDFAIPHNADAETLLALAAKNWKQANAAIAKFSENAEKLAACKVDVPATIDALLGLDNPEARKEATKAQQNYRDQWVAASSNQSKGTLGNTLWDIYNGFTDLQTHGVPGSKSQKDEVDRFIATLDGVDGAKEKATFNDLMAIATA